MKEKRQTGNENTVKKNEMKKTQMMNNLTIQSPSGAPLRSALQSEMSASRLLCRRGIGRRYPEDRFSHVRTWQQSVAPGGSE
jgi:hypothetical protein